MSEEKIPAFREFCNDLYGKILESSKIVDVDEIFVNGDQFNFSLRPTDYDPTTRDYATRTYVPNDDPFAIHRYVIDFDISSILQENVIKQFLPEYAEYFSDINRFSPITAEELAQLKDILVKRSSFSNQFKGTKVAIEFVLSIFANAMGRYLISADPDPYHNFIYRISTDLSRDLWLKDVKPIVHPNGWGDKYILIVPDHPDYIQLRGEAEIAETIANTPACFSYLAAGMAWDRLIHNDALARIDDYHTQYKFGFHPYAYFETLNYIDSVRVELMRHGSFGVTIDRSSGSSVYTLTYNNPGVALEYVWTVSRYGVIVKEQHTFGPTFSFTSEDDSPYEVEVTLKRDDWTMTVGPWTLGVFNRPGLSTPANPAHSYANLTTEECRNQCFEMVNADNGDDHHTLRYHDSAYGGDQTLGWMSEPMSVLYDLDLALSTNYQSNRVFYDGPEMADQYIWSIEKNGHPLQVLTTIVPEVTIPTSEWETEPETVLGSQTWPHAGTKSGWSVTLTLKAGSDTMAVGTVTFGTMPDIEAPLLYDLNGIPTSATNQTFVNMQPVDYADIEAYKYKLDNGSWSGEIVRQSGTFPVINLTSLSDGSHTVTFKARDAAGNWTDDKTKTWTIDTIAPIISLVTTTGSITNQTSITIDVQTTNDAVKYDYRLDNSAWSSKYDLTVDISLTGLSQGSHTIEVRGYDNAGNTDTKSKTWTVDTVAPTASITGFSTETLNGIWTKKRDYSFGVGVDPDVSQYQYQLGTDPWSAWTSSSASFVKNLKDGFYTLRVKGKDSAGNVQSTPTERTWEIRWSDQILGVPLAASNSTVILTKDYIVTQNSNTQITIYNRTTLQQLGTLNVTTIGISFIKFLITSEEENCIWVSQDDRSQTKIVKYNLVTNSVTGLTVYLGRRLSHLIEKDGYLWGATNDNTDYINWVNISTGVRNNLAYPDVSEPGNGYFIFGQPGIAYILTNNTDGVNHKIYKFDMITKTWMGLIYPFAYSASMIYDSYTDTIHLVPSNAGSASTVAINVNTFINDPSKNIPLVVGYYNSIVPMADRFVRFKRNFTTEYNTYLEEIDRTTFASIRQKIVNKTSYNPQDVLGYESSSGTLISSGNFYTPPASGNLDNYLANYLIISNIRW